jgi:hypothetical protein
VATPTTAPPRGAADDDDGSDNDSGGGDASASGGRDLTQLPRALDDAYEAYDSDASLRPVVITPTGPWTKTTHASLLSGAATASVPPPAQDAARREAFDLLDALSRSGALPLHHAALHVLVGAQHAFEESLMDTLIKKNVNPIERCERSQLIMAAALHGVPPGALLRRDARERVAAHSPALFAPPPPPAQEAAQEAAEAAAQEAPQAAAQAAPQASGAQARRSTTGGGGGVGGRGGGGR